MKFEGEKPKAIIIVHNDDLACIFFCFGFFYFYITDKMRKKKSDRTTHFQLLIQNRPNQDLVVLMISQHGDEFFEFKTEFEELNTEFVLKNSKN